jgi:hypothetical protein
VFSVPVVLVATNTTVSKLLRKVVLSTFATVDGDDVKSLEKLLLFPPPGPICRHRFEEDDEDDEDAGEAFKAQQKHVVLVNVAMLPLLAVFSWMRIPRDSRASERGKNGRKKKSNRKRENTKKLFPLSRRRAARAVSFLFF